jgi:hypothetical protein
MKLGGGSSSSFSDMEIFSQNYYADRHFNNYRDVRERLYVPLFAQLAAEHELVAEALEEEDP